VRHLGNRISCANPRMLKSLVLPEVYRCVVIITLYVKFVQAIGMARILQWMGSHVDPDILQKGA